MYDYVYMGVSKNRGTPKWMVDSGKPYEQMDDLGGKNPIFGSTPICTLLMCIIANYFIIKSNGDIMLSLNTLLAVSTCMKQLPSS